MSNNILDDAYQEALNAYNEAYNEALAEYTSNAMEAAAEIAAEAGAEAVKEKEESLEQSYLQDLQDAWKELYGNMSEEALRLLKEHGIYIYCSDVENGIVGMVLEEVTVTAEYTGYEEIFNEAYQEAYQTALDEIMANFEVDFTIEDFIEEPEDWSTSKFFDHYNNGNGQAVTLEEIGYEDEIRESSEYTGMLDRLKQQIQEKVQEDIDNFQPPNGSSEPISYSFSNSYNFVWDVFEIGSATISGNFNGTYHIDDEGNVCWDGTVEIEFYDSFEDPWDVFNLVDGSWDTGTPFDITGNWSEELESE